MADVIADRDLVVDQEQALRAALEHQQHLQSRVDILVRTQKAKDATIQAHRETISYMDQQIRKLRDLVFLLRFCVSQLKSGYEKEGWGLPPILQEYPVVDDNLEDTRKYDVELLRKKVAVEEEKRRQMNVVKGGTAEDKLQKMEDEMKTGVNCPQCGYRMPKSLFPSGPHAHARSPGPRSKSASPSKAHRKFRNLTLDRGAIGGGGAGAVAAVGGTGNSSSGGAAAMNVDGSSSAHTGGHTGTGPATAEPETREEREAQREARKTLNNFIDDIAKNLDVRLDAGLKAVNVVEEDHLVHHGIFACEAAPVLHSAMRVQLRRSENSDVLECLFGEKIRQRFEARCAKMMLEIQSLYMISKNVAAQHDLGNFLPQWLQMVISLFQSERGCIYVYDQASGDLVSRCMTGDVKQAIRVKKGTGLAGHVLAAERPIVVNNSELLNSLSTNEFVVDSSQRTKNIICVPIFMGSTCVGVCELKNKTREITGSNLNQVGKSKKDSDTQDPGIGNSAGSGMVASYGLPIDYTQEDLDALVLLCGVIGPGVTPSHFHKVMKDYAQHETRLMTEIMGRNRTHKLHPLVRAVMKPVSDMLGSERCSLFCGDKQKQTLYAIVAKGAEEIVIEIPDHKGIAGSVYTSGTLLNIKDCYTDPRFCRVVDKASQFQTRTMLCAPIRHVLTGEPIGVMQAINKIGGTFTTNDELRLERLCQIVANILLTAESLNDLTMSTELNERIFQVLSVAVVTFNSFGVCTKANRDIADLFFLESGSSVWVGKHATDLFAQNNPVLLKMWQQCMVLQMEQLREPLPIYPWMGEADGTLRSVRMVPLYSRGEDITTGKKNPIGVLMSFSPTYLRTS